jgi:ABC-type Fe3+/spermidine/putrescine transport system ATPase subunit
VTTLGLKLEGICKKVGTFQLRNIDLTVNDNDYCVLLGPTGAGKTLLLEMVVGFQQPDAGKVFLNGKNLTRLPPEKRLIGYVSQDCVLFPNMDVRGNVEFGLKVAGIGEGERRRRVDAVLESAGLKWLEKRRPATLSGGERQKVALARVLAVEPDLLMLDEPLSALDADAAKELKKELKRIHKAGKTVVHVTHNQVEAFSLATQLAIMRAGEVVQAGSAREVFAEPRGEFVARFLGYENVFHGKAKEGSLVEVDGVVLETAAKPEKSQGMVAVRPEDIQISPSPVPKTAGLNVFEAAVSDWTDQGPVVAVTCAAGLPLTAFVIKSIFLEMNLQEGQRVWLSFKAEAAKILKS